MLVKENLLIQKFKEQKINYPPILIYGPNEGLVRENFLKIKEIFKQDSTEEVNFSGKLINEQPGILIDEIRTVSMFNEQKIIIIEQPVDKNIDLFEDAFVELPDQTLIIVIANNLTKNSKLRKFFESSSKYFSCANYEDDFRSNIQQIHNLEKSINKNLNKDIKNYLNQNLSSDRMISKNEIDKIILLYSENDQIPELEHIKLIFNDNADLGLNKISQLTFSGQPNKVSILAYDALGLIYYCWSSNNFQFKQDQLYTKKGFKGMHGEFFIEKNLSKHKLKIYKVLEKKFVKVY